jgi:membrane fusion protein (multidrug efflux system)
MEVKIGLRLPGKVEILEGLKSGDTVITAGHSRLMRGDSVPVRVVDLTRPGGGGKPGAKPAGPAAGPGAAGASSAGGAGVAGGSAAGGVPAVPATAPGPRAQAATASGRPASQP